MTKVTLSPVYVDEAEAIAKIVRQADRDEICEGLGLDMVYALKMCFGGSIKAQKVCYGDKVLAVVGDAMHDAQQRIGVPWMIATEHIYGHSRAFLKVNRGVMAEMLERHDTLYNFVDARNTKAIRWLKWLGFGFGEAVPYGPKGLYFFPFSIDKAV